MRLKGPGSGGRWKRRLALALASLALLAVLAVFVVSGYVAAKLTVLPREAPAGSPSQHGLTYENVDFTARVDSEELSGWYIYPEGADKRCTVLMIHGKDHNRNDPNIKMLEIANGIARHGYSVLTFDLRAHGESGGKRFSLGYYEQRDVLGAVDYLSKRPDSTGCIAGMGFSTGGVALIESAAEESRVRAVVADSTWPVTRRLLDDELPAESGLPSFFTPTSILMARVMYGMDLDSVRPVDSIDEIAPRPILLIGGAADAHVPVSEARTLHEAAKNPRAELWVVEGARHVRSYADHPREYLDRVLRFLDRSLQK